MPAQDVSVVTRQFEAQLEHYTNDKRGAARSRVISFLAQQFAQDASPQPSGPVHVCEFGGADGLLLASARELLGERLVAVNAELVEAFASRQAHPSITFVPASILDAQFADASFDVVVARHVLHHLVADTLSATRQNQVQALRELARVTRPGGWVLIEEHANPSSLSCKLLYHLSRLSSRAGLSAPGFEVTPYTVVAFLTPADVVRIAVVGTEGRLSVQVHEFVEVPMPLHWRLTMLRRGSGNVFLALRVGAAS